MSVPKGNFVTNIIFTIIWNLINHITISNLFLSKGFDAYLLIFKF